MTTAPQRPVGFDASAQSLFSGQFALLLTIAAVFGLAFSTYFLLPKYLATELSADAVTIGGVTAAFWVSSVLFIPFVGERVDRHGRKLFAGVGGVILAASCVGFLWVDSLGPLIWLLRIGQGLGFTLFYVAIATLAADLAPPARLSQALGIFGAVMISTNAAGPAFAEWTSAHFGWRAVFAATAIAAVLAALLTRLLPDQPKTDPLPQRAGMLQVMKRPGMMRILVVSMLMGWVFGTLFTFYQPWALSRGIDKVAVYLVAYALAAVLVRVLFGDLADRLGRLRVVRVTVLLYAIAPLALIWLDFFGLLVAGAMLGLAQGIYYPAFNAVAIDCAAATERGKVMAAYNGAFNLGLSAGSIALGYVLAATNYQTIFAIAATISVAAFGLLVRDVAQPAAAGQRATVPEEPWADQDKR